jgi:hypothetical protein
MIEVCEECGVPIMVSSQLNWEANGVISLVNSPRNRMVFFESETIDHVFRGIEELIGVPIEHIVIESRCRETKRYIERAFPPEVRKIIDSSESSLEARMAKMTPQEKETLLATMRVITQAIIDIASNYGYGHQEPGELWEKEDDYPWRVQLVTDPFSLLFIAADNLGSVEAFERSSMQVKYDEMEAGTYRIEVYPGEHPLELQERLQRKCYEYKPGDIHYERCPQCGVPLSVAGRIWDVDKGTIHDPDTGRRMAIFGPFSVDSIFYDLEKELGQEIPDTVIEATRRYIKTAWNVERWNRDGLTFQQMITMRGLGNLVRFEGDKDHLDVVIENSCLHLPVVGTVQALVELAYRVESSSVTWTLAKDGDLSLTVNVER